MIILQMGVLDDRILFWGEKPAEPAAGSARRRRTSRVLGERNAWAKAAT
jgi:hypothetical protein